MFTNEELEALAAKESRARQNMENQSSQQSFSKGSQVSQSNDPSRNDAAYRSEFKAGKYSMTEAEYVSLRRAEDGLESFIPDKPPATPTDVALNPLASGL